MKNLSTLFLILSLLFVIPVSGQNAKQYYKAGLDFMETSNFNDAIQQFTNALNLDPKYYKAYLDRALAFENLNQFESALEDYNRALVFENRDEEIYYNAARIAFQLKQFDLAKKNAEAGLEIKPKYLEALQLQTQILLALEDFDNALIAAKKSLVLKDNSLSYYYHGQVYEKLNNYAQAESDYKKAISKDKSFIDPYISLASLLIQLNRPDEALEYSNAAISVDSRSMPAYLVRSRVYVKKLEYPKAIDDISKNILINPDDAGMYLIRGKYYQEFTQHQNAINDFTKVIMLDEKNSEAYYKRAYSYEQIANFQAAIKDYNKLSELSKYDPIAKQLQDEAQIRLFELNREYKKPDIVIINPEPVNNSKIKLAKNKNVISLQGKIIDDSDIELLQINNKDVPFVNSDNGVEFIATVDLDEATTIIVSAVDVYKNQQNSTYVIERTEIEPPKISILAPYASDNGEIYLDSPEQTIYVEGTISDESLIQSILIDGVSASYKLNEVNPRFTANVEIANKASILVKASDVFGNIVEQTYIINREGIALAENNPMGKTWVVFIENSNYQSFASLDGPTKDITLMRSALSRYKINKMIHKKDLDKKDLERFFSIELRDLVKSNRVNTLLIWYAGHGKFINETGYWIPVDAKRDDEFTYFNINALRASLQSYIDLTHTLVVTDACESGPTFYQAMRDGLQIKSCENWEATKFKSSQVFSSAGYELAVDNSQFTRTFANTLANNPNTCIPIEAIVQKVTSAVERNNQQKPVFGKIVGLEDENGTFFFVAKE
ncbi:MAG: tetratricopeptide repeat protein [Bacteroidales bacterium]|nr:tetratricopeptide repeat protein [Bacteroidales bacterium]